MTQIAIVVYPGFTALDFIGPYEVLRNLPDTEVRFVWHESGPITADSGVLIVGATHSFDETPTPDIVLVPGGMSTFEHARDEKVLDWVRRTHQSAMWTTSVCSGSLILAAAGLLEGKRATSHWMVVPMLRTFGVTPVNDDRIVREGRIVTAAGVSAGIDLGLWLAGELGGEARAKAIQLAIEYDPQPPFDFGPHVQGISGHSGNGDGGAHQRDNRRTPTESVGEAALGCGTCAGACPAAALIPNPLRKTPEEPDLRAFGLPADRTSGDSGAASGPYRISSQGRIQVARWVRGHRVI